MSEILLEVLYRFWRCCEKFMAWRARRAKDREPEFRESWWARREAAEGYLGTELKYKPTPKFIRLLDLLVWYSPVGQFTVWWTKRGDW